MKYYKFIDENTPPKRAPYPLVIDGEINCTTSESVYNSQGYYRLEVEPYPETAEYSYIPYYEQATPDRLYHIQRWKQRDKNYLETTEGGEEI